MKLSFLLLFAALFASQAEAFVCEHSYSGGATCNQRSLGAKYTNQTATNKIVIFTAVGKYSTPKVAITVDGKSYTTDTGPIIVYEHHGTEANAVIPPGSTYSVNASGALEYWMWGEE